MSDQKTPIEEINEYKRKLVERIGAKTVAAHKGNAAGENCAPLIGSAASPITYRMLHEHVAGMALEDSFFTVSDIDPDASVKCNCRWNQGHEAHCDIVTAKSMICQPPNGKLTHGG